MPERLAKRLLIIGWDAADWKIIDPLLKRGAMPHLARLLKAGSRADLATLEPRLSPILWTSIATGKTADAHGILNFVEPDPASADGTGIRISSSTTRKTKALWNILTQSGLRTNVVSWYASHPAEPIRGVCVSNLLVENMPVRSSEPWPAPSHTVHPEELTDELCAGRVHPGAVKPYQLLAVLPGLGKAPARDPRVVELAKVIAKAQSVQNAALAVMRRDPSWDCTMLFYDAIDVAGHHFMQYHPPRMAHVSPADFELFRPVMDGVYKLHDTLLGELLDAAGEGTTVMLLSDHGFHSDESRPPPRAKAEGEHPVMDATWHRAFGVLALSGPGIQKGAAIRGPTLLDMTPTALALLGLPAASDMPGRPLSEALASPAPDRIPSWDDVPGDAGLHPPDLRQDPFEARDAIAQLVDLGYLSAIPEDAAKMLDGVERESRYNLGIVLMRNQRADRAVELFEALHREYPDQRRYATILARCLFELGRWADARARLEECLRGDPTDYGSRLCIAATLFGERQLEKAAAELEALDKLIPSGSAEERRLLEFQAGMVYVLLRRPADARRIYTRVLTRDPDNSQARHGLALAAIGQRRFEEAVEHCLAVLDREPAFADAHYTLGVALAWLEDPGHAVPSFQAALTFSPGLVEAHRFLAALFRERGEAAEAARHQEVADRLIREAIEKGSGRPPEPPMGVSEWESRRAR